MRMFRSRIPRRASAFIRIFGTDPILLEPGYAQCEFVPAAIRQAGQHGSLCLAPSNLMEKKR